MTLQTSQTDTCQRFTATHIVKSLKPTRKPKFGKECVCPTAPQTDKRTKEKEQRRHNSSYPKGEVSYSTLTGRQLNRKKKRFGTGGQREIGNIVTYTNNLRL